MIGFISVDISGTVGKVNAPEMEITEFKMSRLMTKPTKCCVRPANTQISLGIRSTGS